MSLSISICFSEATVAAVVEQGLKVRSSSWKRKKRRRFFCRILHVSTELETHIELI